MFLNLTYLKEGGVPQSSPQPDGHVSPGLQRPELTDDGETARIGAVTLTVLWEINKTQSAIVFL